MRGAVPRFPLGRAAGPAALALSPSRVFAPDGRYSVLTAAWTYTDPSGGTAPGSAGSGTGGGSGGGTDTGAGGGGGVAGGGTDGSPGAGGDSSADVRTGQGGLRLVRSAVFAGLRTVWSIGCSLSCQGIRV